MTVKEALEKLQTLEAVRYAYQHALSVMTVDGSTKAPAKSYLGRARSAGYLSGELHDLMARPETRETVETILDNSAEAGPVAARKAELLREDLLNTLLFSREEAIRNQQLLTEADAVWRESKVKSDFSRFKPCLEKMIAYKRTFAERKDPSRRPYDVLLDTYEKGACMQDLDVFFALCARELPPVIQAVTEKVPPRSDFLHRVYPRHLQEQFSGELMGLLGLPKDRCAIAETEHPYTSGINKWDVRISTHYHEDDVSLSMYSVIHEGGHAIYELGVQDEYQFTRLQGGVTMGIHESQSRFYENLIGRSRPFCDRTFEIARRIFPDQLQGVTEDEWYLAMNLSRPGLIRTEADELTYPLHVMIRYEIEKKIFSGDVKVEDLPQVWNEMYKEHLGLTVPDDRRGVLQDSHWSTGYFGYFPSYALGSAYGVQMLEEMKKTVDVEGAVRAGDLTPVTAWLRERIHRHGKFLTPAEVLKNAGVAPFDPSKYTDYLKDKYRALYHL
ncbi:MAG: carboxypeptidase M32 [Clostridia bacterium]|nr:carboxypeptidase M32 [Clostridia bacterium]